MQVEFSSAFFLNLFFALYSINEAENRFKRSLWNFGFVISCATGRSSMDYNGYGCWCGFGGSATPVDGIDRCCLSHDMCYRATVDNGYCNSITKYISGYNWSCEPLNSHALATANLSSMARTAYTYAYRNLNSVPICTSTKSVCGRVLCQCDVDAAMCFTMYQYPTEKLDCPPQRKEK